MRQGEEKFRAVAEFTFDPDFTAVGLHNVFHNGKPQAGAARFTGAGAIHAIESFKDAFAGFFRNAGTVVAHAEFHQAVRTGASGDGQAAARG